MFFIPQTSILPDGERELALLPSSGGVVPPYRLSGAPADAHVRNLITTESSLAYRFHQAAPLHPSALPMRRIGNSFASVPQAALWQIKKTSAAVPSSSG